MNPTDEIAHTQVLYLNRMSVQSDFCFAMFVFCPEKLASFCLSISSFLSSISNDISLPFSVSVIQGTTVNILDLAAKLDSTAEYLCKISWGEVQFPPPFGRDALPEEAYIADLDAKSGASLKLTVLNPSGRIWTMVAGGGASVVYSDTICDLGQGHELANYGEYSGRVTRCMVGVASKHLAPPTSIVHIKKLIWWHSTYYVGEASDHIKAFGLHPTNEDLLLFIHMYIHYTHTGAPSESQTFEYAKTLLSLMTRVKHPQGKVLIVGGGIANFTNVASTFKGIVRAFTKYHHEIINSDISIFVRRGGPNYQEGLRLMRETGRNLGLTMHVFGPETHMTSIVGMGLGVHPIPKPRMESLAPGTGNVRVK